MYFSGNFSAAHLSNCFHKIALALLFVGQIKETVIEHETTQKLTHYAALLALSLHRLVLIYCTLHFEILQCFTRWRDLLVNGLGC